MSMQSYLNSGRDLLGEEVLRKAADSGEGVTRKSVEECLPPVEEERYAYLSGLCTKGAVLVDAMGRLYDQAQLGFSPGRILKDAKPFFSPAEIDARLGETPPRFERHPESLCLSWRHERGDDSLAFKAFVEALDPAEHPRLFLRWTRRVDGQSEEKWLTLCVAGLQDGWPDTSREIARGEYERRRRRMLDDWRDRMPRALFQTPDEMYNRLFRQCYQNARASFADAQPKYGHAFYGVSLHDHFPPNYLTMIEAACIEGDLETALSVAKYVLRMIVHQDGSLAYYGPSASEYGQLLWLLERIEPLAGGALEGSIVAVRRMAEHLLSLRLGKDGLIEAGAEADTRFRVAAYMSNNLWAVRGLRAAAALLKRNGFEPCLCERLQAAADELAAGCRERMQKESVHTPFGELPPFRLGYPALPLTLSSCRDTSYSIDEAEMERYLDDSYPTGDLKGGQELSENTYANYRYYPEMLSSRLLSPEQENAIVSLRRRAGGELLGMTRLFGWLDDWPAFHYARFLLETRQTDAYHLLLHAHSLFHGWSELAVYYEQTDTRGRVVAEDCVPSTLMTPLLLGWALVFEPVSANELWLMAGVPLEWYLGGGAGVRNTLCRYGYVSVSDHAENESERRFSYDLPPIPNGVSVYWYHPRRPAQRRALPVSDERDTHGSFIYRMEEH